MQLHAYKDSPKFSDCDFSFDYCSVTGKLNYPGQTTREDILFATHQIAKYSSDPRKEHGEAIIYLVRYLKKTRHLGSDFIQTLPKVLNAIVMPISLEIGTETMHNLIPVLPSREVDGSFSMQGVLLFGLLNCNPK